MVLIRVTLVEIDIITKQIKTKLLLNNLHFITCYVLVIERNTHAPFFKYIWNCSGKSGFKLHGTFYTVHSLKELSRYIKYVVLCSIKETQVCSSLCSSSLDDSEVPDNRNHCSQFYYNEAYSHVLGMYCLFFKCPSLFVCLCS